MVDSNDFVAPAWFCSNVCRAPVPSVTVVFRFPYANEYSRPDRDSLTLPASSYSTNRKGFHQFLSRRSMLPS